ncbi:MAG: hypothetical protein IJO64_07400 [Clostridia bacterium]|nr:hypothetical protein [Clostridia bacterium]
MERNVAIANPAIKLADNEMIKIRGRHTVVNGMLAFDWTNSGFAFNFIGTGFILSLGEYSYEQPAYVKIIIDGGRRQRFAVVNGQEKLIIEGLSNKRHRAEVLKVTESDVPLLFDTVALLGKDASLRNPPFVSRRRIEFIGDSITAGYGALGGVNDPTYQTFQQDGTYSYAYLTAEMLGADGRFICNSGKGIVCNCEGNREDVKAGQYCSYLTRKGGECNDGWQADVVVINIGTNDSGGPAGEEEFKDAARALIEKVRSRYPECIIIWMYGLMSQYYAETLRGFIRDYSEIDDKVHFLFVDTMFGNELETGANGHPNVKAHTRAANLLAKKVRALTGWITKETTEE